MKAGRRHWRRQWAALLGRLQQEEMFVQVNTLWKPNVPQLYVDVDREKAKALGVSVDEIFNTLSATLGSYYVNDFNKYGRTWQVLMSAEPAYRTRPDDIGAVWVRSDRNEMVPLRSVARIEYTSGPDSLDRYNNLQAVKVFATAAPGHQLGAGDQAKFRRSRAKRCRLISTLNSPVRRFRSSSRPALRDSRWASRW